MKISVYVGTSLDGFLARPDGDFSWLSRFGDAEAVAAYNEFMARIDAIVIGRNTFDVVMKFPDWPYEKPVFVLSSTIDAVPEKTKGRATLLSSPPGEVCDHLDSLGHSNIYIDGGLVIQSFLKEGLVDELIIAKVPVVIGSGIPLFGSVERDILFDHVRTTVASNGLVRSYYTRPRVA